MAIGIGRRQFISAALGGAAVWPLAARAQHPSMPVVGYLGFSSSSEIGPRLAAFLAGLKENGYVDGQSLKIEYRWAEGQAQRIPTFAAEPDPVDDVAGSIGVVHNAGERLPHLRYIGWAFV
jgi:hypothetical protein